MEDSATGVEPCEMLRVVRLIGNSNKKLLVFLIPPACSIITGTIACLGFISPTRELRVSMWL